MEPMTPVEELFGREYARLVRALGVAFEPEAAADAVQEAFIEADRRWRRVSTLDDPAGWVRRVALNRLLNGRRVQLRRAEIVATIRPVARDDLTTEYLDLRDAIDALPPRMRLIVCLHYLAGYTVAEVGAALEVSPGTVKSTLHDARTRLRSSLEEQHG
jgi:RNA polymerase sigma factor (sigma-70 family)